MDSFAFDCLYRESVYAFEPGLVVVIDGPWAVLQAGERDLLSRITTAIGFPMDSITITQRSGDGIQWPGTPRLVLAFTGPVDGKPLHQILQVGSVQLVVTQPLSLLVSDEDQRARLRALVPSLTRG